MFNLLTSLSIKIVTSQSYLNIDIVLIIMYITVCKKCCASLVNVVREGKGGGGGGVMEGGGGKSWREGEWGSGTVGVGEEGGSEGSGRSQGEGRG